MRREQWAHQKEEYDLHKVDPARALLWQMRTGKTKAIVDNACYLWEAMEIGGVLVVAPNGVHRNWLDVELPKHHWGPWAGMAWRNSDPRNAEKWENLCRSWASSPRAEALRWFAVNMESLIMPSVRKAMAQFVKLCGSVMLVADESHHFAVPGAKRTSVARGLGRACAYRRILTGTPVENSPLQAFSQYEILEKGALGYPTYGSYKGAYAIYENGYGGGGRTFPRLVGYRNTEDLKRRMAPYTSVVLRSDCEDLPPVLVDERWVGMSRPQYDLWQRCKANELGFLEERGMQDAVTGGAALIKLQQIEGGFWKTADGYDELVPPASNAKMLALIDELKQYDRAVIVWFQFLHEIAAAKRAIEGELKEPCGLIHGKVKDRKAVLDGFRLGEFRILLGQPMAAGEGYDISSADKILWYSQTPDAIVRAQANERATAVGKASVEIVDVMVRGGVCEHFRGLTVKKATLADDISKRGMREILNNLKGDYDGYESGSGSGGGA